MSTVEAARRYVGATEDVPEGGRLIVDLDGRTIGLFRLDGALYCYENRCAHMGGPVCQGRIMPGVKEVNEAGSDRNDLYFDEQDMHIVCPWHGYEYSIRTGRHAGTSTVGLRSFEVTEDGGGIYVVL